MPFAEEGQGLLSFRDIGTLAVIDLDSEEIVWARRGDWAGQHDPDILPNGNILLFDNLGKLGPGGRSRILDTDPQTGAEVWRYEGSGEVFFESDARASQERLPNGTRSEAHTSELQSLMRISYAVFCLKKKKYSNITYKRQENT